MIWEADLQDREAEWDTDYRPAMVACPPRRNWLRHLPEIAAGLALALVVYLLVFE